MGYKVGLSVAFEVYSKMWSGVGFGVVGYVNAWRGLVERWLFSITSGSVVTAPSRLGRVVPFVCARRRHTFVSVPPSPRAKHHSNPLRSNPNPLH